MPLNSNSSHSIAAAREHPLADGRIHSVKIRYYNHIEYDFLPYFSATQHLVQYLKDGGEGRRMGTLVVWMDDAEEPLTAVPVNLNVALRLQEGGAFIGFTASTGRGKERDGGTGGGNGKEGRAKRWW
jgi:hypothetical protein